MKQHLIFAASLLALQSGYAQNTVQECNKAYPANTVPHNNCVKRVTGAAPAPAAKPPVAAPSPMPASPVAPPPAARPPVAPPPVARPPMAAPVPMPAPPVAPPPAVRPPVAAPLPVPKPPAAPTPVQPAPSISYQLQAPPSAKVGESISITVFPQGGALTAQAAVVFPDGKAQFTKRVGNAFIFQVVQDGVTRFELREATSSGIRVVQAGQIQFQRVSAPPPPLPSPPPISYRVQPPTTSVVGQQFSFTVASANGAPLNSSIAVMLPSNMAKFTGRNGNQFTFIALAAGTATWELRESTSPGAKVLGSGQVSLTPVKAESPKITGVTVKSQSVNVGQPITLLFFGQNLTNAVAVTASDCDQPQTQLIGSNQIQHLCTPRKAGNMSISWASQKGGVLNLISSVAVSTGNSGKDLAPSVVSCPMAGSGWTNTLGSPYHKPGGGIGGADDTHAFDLNLNEPTFNSDKGKPVLAVADGEIFTGGGWGGKSAGQILVNHTDANGNKWSSGYLHLATVSKQSGSVRKGDTLGTIGKTNATNEHLHFVVYAGHGGKKSVPVSLSCGVKTVR